MWGGRLAKARRGELGIELPMGYWRRPSGEVVLDPDEQVRAVVRLVFAKFEELGTLHAVLAWLVAHGIELGGRERCGPERGEVVWRRPNRTLVRNMIRSPVYAGIYAFGRHHSEYRGGGRTERQVKDPADWLVYLPDRLPAYLTIEQWQRNLAILEANRNTADTAGSPRAGQALLSGLLWCTRCGKRMNVRYRSQVEGGYYAYLCNWEAAHYGGQMCQQLVGDGLDDCVTQQLLTAITPAALELSLAAAEQVEADRAAVDAIWRQRLERADYQVDRARRCYRLAEPENRLVVRQLEADWEEALAAREQLGEQYNRFTAATPRTLTRVDRETIQALAADLPGLWHAPSTTPEDRKHLVRLLIEKVAVHVRGDTEQVDVTITWAGGRTSVARARRPVARLDQLSYYPQLAQRVRDLAATGITHRQIAERINAEGWKPPKRGTVFSEQSICHLCHRLGIRRHPGVGRPVNQGALGENEWWLTHLASELGMPTVTLFSWLQRGWITGRREPAPGRRWIIRADAVELDRLRELRGRPNGYYVRHHFLDQHNSRAAPDAEEGERHVEQSER
jgi:hypothetical protein